MGDRAQLVPIQPQLHGAGLLLRRLPCKHGFDRGEPRFQLVAEGPEARHEPLKIQALKLVESQAPALHGLAQRRELAHTTPPGVAQLPDIVAVVHRAIQAVAESGKLARQLGL